MTNEYIESEAQAQEDRGADDEFRCAAMEEDRERVPAGARQTPFNHYLDWRND